MKLSSNKLFFLYTLLALLVVLSLSVLFYRQETLVVMNNFRDDVDDKVVAIERQIGTDFEALYALKGLFDASGEVTAQAFHIMASGILTRHKEIQALQWVPWVRSEQRSQLEQRRRIELSNFVITEQHSQGLMVPAKIRVEYYPIYYIEPFESNEVAIGFDMGSTPERKQALERSRDTGRLLATSPIILVQEPEEEKGFIAMLPIFRDQATMLSQRRSQLRGFVMSSYRIPTIILSAISHSRTAGIIFSLYDISGEQPELLFRSHNLHDQQMQGESYRYQTRLNVGGRVWEIDAYPTIGYMAEQRGMVPYLILLLGMMFVAAVAIYVRLMIYYRRRAELLVVERTRELENTKRALEKQNRTDQLTQIDNRKGFDEALEREWHRALREEHPLTLLMIDVDYFKAFNDNYGHQSGDNALKRIAQTLSDSFQRSADVVARYGGEEFAAILPNTPNAVHLAERCRLNILALQIPHLHSSVVPVVSISIGLCTVMPNGDIFPEHLILEADRALYQAKEQGRNRIVEGEITPQSGSDPSGALT